MLRLARLGRFTSTLSKAKHARDWGLLKRTTFFFLPRSARSVFLDFLEGPQHGLQTVTSGHGPSLVSNGAATGLVAARSTIVHAIGDTVVQDRRSVVLCLKSVIVACFINFVTPRPNFKDKYYTVLSALSVHVPDVDTKVSKTARHSGCSSQSVCFVSS